MNGLFETQLESSLWRSQRHSVASQAIALRSLCSLLFQFQFAEQKGTKEGSGHTAAPAFAR